MNETSRSAMAVEPMRITNYKFVILISIVCLTGYLRAQPPDSALHAADTAGVTTKLGWKLSTVAGINFSSTAVSGNWTGAETNNWTVSAFVDGTAESGFPMFVWASRFNAEYGQAKYGSRPAVKGADLIHSDTDLRWLALQRFNPYADLTFDSQFDAFLKPATLSQSAGMSFVLVDRDKSRLTSKAGIALREVLNPGHLLRSPLSVQVVQDTARDNGSRVYFGLTSITDYAVSLGGSVKLTSTLRLFAPVSFDGADLRWESALYLKLSKYLTLKAGYLALLAYDRDYKPVWSRDLRTRFTTGLGASWALF
ncbi:MAG: DUF3078 domain-containing protein [Candidatus Edwardsbacteria bacterium]|nr:DUF3078 domain-containing protein [Candidatus Edwardsbacteria bacterium]